jgi:hypothetical protein
MNMEYLFRAAHRVPEILPRRGVADRVDRRCDAKTPPGAGRRLRQRAGPAIMVPEFVRIGRRAK